MGWARAAGGDDGGLLQQQQQGRRGGRAWGGEDTARALRSMETVCARASVALCVRPIAVLGLMVWGINKIRKQERQTAQFSVTKHRRSRTANRAMLNKKKRNKPKKCYAGSGSNACISRDTLLLLSSSLALEADPKVNKTKQDHAPRVSREQPDTPTNTNRSRAPVCGPQNGQRPRTNRARGQLSL